jgi:hypothetical protein
MSAFQICAVARLLGPFARLITRVGFRSQWLGRGMTVTRGYEDYK